MINNIDNDEFKIFMIFLMICILFKEKTLYYSMEKNNDENSQQCSTCKQYRNLDWFRPEGKHCNQCLETIKRHREKHKEQVSNYAKGYHNQHKANSGEKQKTKEHKVKFK